jgi:hypothetical protein
MDLRHEIDLPHDEAFYTLQRTFDVSIDDTACGNFTHNGVQFQLAPATPALAPLLLQQAAAARHEASLEEISEAAMRFYRSGGVSSFSAAEYVSMLFMMRYGFGHAFRTSARNSIEHAPRSAGATFHSEALSGHTELFAYGLACRFAARMLGVPIDRFFFVTAAGARADFQARITAADLRAQGSGMAALAPAGYVLELEVKARTGWASFRTNSDSGRALLKNLADKVARQPTHAFLSIIVGLPGTPGGPRSMGHIVLADPGEGIPLGVDAQTQVLLEGAVALLYRHGLWITLRQALDWLALLRPLTEHEHALREFVAPHDEAPRQYDIVRRESGGRTYNGRVFNDVVLRVGRIGERGMSREQAQERLRLDQVGRAWYSGVDVRFQQIVEQRDAPGLRTYGVRGVDESDLSGRSAFYVEEWPMDEPERASVRNILRLAINRWG